jgi:hypothetical protein
MSGGLGRHAASHAATRLGDQGVGGIALGSEALLAVERTAAFFVAWMLALMILAESCRGRLPLEISGRGVRYADVPTSQANVQEARDQIERLKHEIAVQRGEIADLQECIYTTSTGSRDAKRQQ